MKHKVGDKVLIKGEVINHSQFGECRVSISGCTENDKVYMWFNDDAIIEDIIIEDNNTEVKIGDIVEDKWGNGPAVITSINGDLTYCIMYHDGDVVESIDMDEFTKTGKHIDIESFLKQISE